jgi:hypothetical protein
MDFMMLSVFALRWKELRQGILLVVATPSEENPRSKSLPLLYLAK